MTGLLSTSKVNLPLSLLDYNGAVGLWLSVNIGVQTGGVAPWRYISIHIKDFHIFIYIYTYHVGMWRSEGWTGEGVAKVDHTTVLHRVAWQPKSGHHGDSDLFAGHTHAPRFGSSALECRPLLLPPTPTMPPPHDVSPATFSGPLDLIVVANFSLFLPPLPRSQQLTILSHAYTYIYYTHSS